MGSPPGSEGDVDPIGGYFELEVQPRGAEPYPGALRFQSARTAFLALLNARRPERVWMPWYLCDSMVAPARAAGIPVSRYALQPSLAIATDVRLSRNDLLLYPNYFGICSQHVDAVLQDFPPSQVVIDNSQAFFAEPRPCLANIYSPRKFFGVPDGGYLVTAHDVPEPEQSDEEGSLARCSHLLLRLALGPQAGYAAFQRNEQSLGSSIPYKMSALTRRMLAGIDYAEARIRRERNFRDLHVALQGRNQLKITHVPDAPLCYPFLTDNPALRDRLHRRGVFVPNYWPEVRADAQGKPPFELMFAQMCLPLPCDQRYGRSDVDRILSILASS